MSKLERTKKLIEFKENLPMALLKMAEELNTKLDNISTRVEALEKKEIPEAKEISLDGIELMFENFVEEVVTKVERKNGVDGKDGMDGSDGKDGVDGKDGKRGKDGDKGDKGKDGADGKPGSDGIDGKDGLDGSPDLPEEVRKKLETLKGDERLDVKAIKNIEDIINKAVKTAKGGGGGGGGANLHLKTVSTTYQADRLDNVILCDATSGAFTVTLSRAELGKVFFFKKLDSTSNKVTIDGWGTQTIDRTTTFDIELQDESIVVYSDGSNWHII